MAKKKKSRRKQQRLQAQKRKQYQAPAKALDSPATDGAGELPSSAVAPPQAEEAAKSKAATTKPKKPSISDQIADDAVEHAYVKGDLRRIGFLALGLIGIIVILWLVLEKTSLGPTIFHLIKI